MSQHGSEASFAVDNAAGTLTVLSTWINSTDFNPEQDVHDDTTYGQTGHTYRGGLTNGTITISGLWDKTVSTGPDVTLTGLLAKKTPVDFEFGPEGATSGDVKKSGMCVLQSYSTSAPVADLVTFTATFQISGAVTSGTYA